MSAAVDHLPVYIVPGYDQAAQRSTKWSSESPSDARPLRLRPQSHLPLSRNQLNVPDAHPTLPSPLSPHSFRSEQHVSSRRLEVDDGPQSPPYEYASNTNNSMAPLGAINPFAPASADPFVQRAPRTITLPSSSIAPSTFSFSVPSDPSTVSHVLDRAGNAIYSIRAPGRRKVTVSDEYGDVVGKVKWPAIGGSPSVRLNRDVPMRIRDWIRYSPKEHCRWVLLRGDRYFLADTHNGCISIFKNGQDDADRVGIITFSPTSLESVQLDLIPQLLVLLEEFVILASILNLSRRINKSDRKIWGSKFSEIGDVRMH